MFSRLHPRGRGHWRHRDLLLAFVLLFAPIAGIVPAGAQAANPPSLRYFAPKTGHTVADPFLQQWIALDGAASLGNPITEPLTVGKMTVQYFEYGLLTHGSSKTNRAMAGGLLIALQTQSHAPQDGRRSSSPINDASGQFVVTKPNQPGVAWNADSHHSISGAILKHFQSSGGAARYGKPLTEAYRTSGMIVQWFEFGRIQVNVVSGAVSSAPVGFELARLLGFHSEPVARGSLPLFQTSRFATYKGDGTIPEATGVFEPVTIKIPAISVDAKIEQVGIVNGAMGIPADAWNVGWYPQLSWPGEYTNVVMAGHRDWWGIGPTVFYNLPNLASGEMIYLVGSNGKGATYRIKEVYSVGSETNAGDVVGDTGSDVLTLITCDGSFNGAEYASRQIIRAQRI